MIFTQDDDFLRLHAADAEHAGELTKMVDDLSAALQADANYWPFDPAAAEARAIYLAQAAQRLGVGADRLSIEDGTIVGPGNLSTSYWELADDALLARDATPGVAVKPPTARRIAGTAVGRLDFPDKVFGRPRFVHDLAMPELLHARVLKPATPGARLLALDEGATRALAG